MIGVTMIKWEASLWLTWLINRSKVYRTFIHLFSVLITSHIVEDLIHHDQIIINASTSSNQHIEKLCDSALFWLVISTPFKIKQISQSTNHPKMSQIWWKMKHVLNTQLLFYGEIRYFMILFLLKIILRKFMIHLSNIYRSFHIQILNLSSYDEDIGLVSWDCQHRTEGPKMPMTLLPHRLSLGLLLSKQRALCLHWVTAIHCDEA